MTPGLYEQLLTLALQERLDELADPRLWVVAPVDEEDAHTAIAQFLEHILANGLAGFRGREAADRRLRLVKRIVAVLKDELGADWDASLSIATPLRRLLAIHAAPLESAGDRPDTPLAHSALLTGTRLDPSLGSQLRKEIATADSVDILCSFIRWSGLRVLLEDLRTLTDQGPSERPRLRVITTSYMGATDPKAIEAKPSRCRRGFQRPTTSWDRANMSLTPAAAPSASCGDCSMPFPHGCSAPWLGRTLHEN